jgi:sulfate transport system permease protein
MRNPWKQHSVLPGFGLTLGLTISYLSLVVLIPLAAMILQAGRMSWPQFWTAISSARAVASYKLTVGASLTGACINAVFGLIVAWVLVRYKFPGRRLVDAVVDLPFALPTAVSGIVLTTLYSRNGWIGHLLEPLGIKVAFTPLGITVALTFIGLPFIVRMVEPALQELDSEVEEAAASLGANRWQTFWRVIFPSLTPALLTGFALSFARALGEYGSVVFIAGNMPLKTEIVPLLIIIKLEQFDVPGATALASVMLLFSFLMLLAINLLQMWSRRRHGAN